MRRSHIYTRGAAPHTHLAEKLSYLKEYLVLSKCVQNFKFLAPIVYEIRGRGGRRGTLRPRTSPGGKIIISEKYARPIWMYAKFQLSSYNTFRDMRGPKFTAGALGPPHAPSGKMFVPEKSTWPYLNCVKFRLSSSRSFLDTRGLKFALGDAAFPACPLAEKCSYLKRVLGHI